MTNRLFTRIVCMMLIGMFVNPGWADTKKHQASTEIKSAARSSQEMQRLAEALGGNWRVSESFEIDATRQGAARQGTASFRLGPGVSLIEDYRSNGSAGKLDFLALFWWDQSAKVYRLLTCANDDGCDLRGELRWEGNILVNSWEENINGQVAPFKDSFVDITPSAFRLISEGSVGDKTIWRVITKYTRARTGNVGRR